MAQKLVGGRRPQTLSYFTPGTRVIPEPRTNTLIILGTETAVRKIEDFILKEIDKEIEKPYAPIHVYELKHLQAKNIAKLLSDAVQFQKNSEAAKAGGVRDEDKFMKPVAIIAEDSGNRLIITADYDDYFKIHEILKKIDIEQPQIALRVLIVDVDFSNTQQFGAQIRNKKPGSNGLLSNNVNFQTSGLAGSGSIVENSTGSGATRLLGNLVTLATGGAVGSTYVTLGSDCWGVWGMLEILQSYTQTNVLASPFLVTSNNYQAMISVGETRRVQIGTTVSAGTDANLSYADLKADLTVTITPQISYEGFVTLKIVVRDDIFTTTATDPITAGNRTEREIATQVILANNEVLALGGLIRDSVIDAETKVPVLGDIPIIGWFFKNKQKTKTRSSILVLVSAEVIPVDDDVITNRITAEVVNDSKETMQWTDTRSKDMDPVHKWFFNDQFNDSVFSINDFVSREQSYLVPKQEIVEGKKKRLSEYL